MNEAQLTFNPTFQSAPLVVTGDLEVVESIHADLQAQEARLMAEQPKVAKVSAKVIETAQTAPESLTGRKATVTAKLYDIVYGRNMYDLLKQKRQDERDLAMATKLGLISIEDVSCQKHRKAIAKLHGMVE